LTPSECKYHIVPATLLIFVDVGENLIMLDDVVIPSNPLVVLVEEEELKKTSLDVNVSQRPCDKELFKKVVRIRVDCSAWDRRLSSNPHALMIYLEFVLARGATPKRFEEYKCEDDDVHFHCQT
jgi:hypothetical protein